MMNAFPKPGVEVYIVPMTIEEWAAVPGNPRQRNTEAHAKVALAWLTRFSPTHLDVAMAELPNGNRFKLDGHTRDYSWTRNLIPRPPQPLRVRVYPVRNLAEVLELYTHFDNAKVAESTGDRTFGAMREIGFQAHGAFLGRCRFSRGVRAASAYAGGMIADHETRGVAEYDLLPPWRAELELLDALDPDVRTFPGPLVSAFLLTCRRRAGKAQDFWLRYKGKEGRREGKQRDPVQALLELMMMNTNSRAKLQNYEMCGRAISACEAFVRGEAYVTMLKVTAPERYLPAAQRKTFGQQTSGQQTSGKVFK